MTDELSRIIAGCLADFETISNARVEIVAIDCHPWDGHFAVSVLLESDIEEDPAIASPDDMAAWPHHNFLQNHTRFDRIGRSVEAQYLSAKNEHEYKVTVFDACVEALNSQTVAKALSALRRTESFRMSVTDPDEGTEYWHA